MNGARPPFGHLYDMAMYVEEMLTHEGEIGFNAGTHNGVVRLGYGWATGSDAEEICGFPSVLVCQTEVAGPSGCCVESSAWGAVPGVSARHARVGDVT